MSSDPWSGIGPPRESTRISARRADEASPWDFYWGLDSDRRCLLVLRHKPDCAPRTQLPQLRGMQIVDQEARPDEGPALILRLLDSGLRDIFYRLCLDIIGNASREKTEPQAVATAVARTWRWHHLLRGGGSGLLTIEEQQGLIGEMLVLERYFLAAVPSKLAVGAWRGPLGAPQDFVLGKMAIESKARGASDATQIAINSEYQLDDRALNVLFIHLCVFHSAPGEDDRGFTVTDVACRIKERLLRHDSGSAEQYEALLTAAGFRYEDDYSETRWTGGERGIYRVTGAFPRLTPATMPVGVAHVKYVLSLAACGSFLVPPEVLEGAITAGPHGR